jgi:hypothetical protein
MQSIDVGDTATDADDLIKQALKLRITTDMLTRAATAAAAADNP